jgi:acetylornithine deacetylase/succinyl-diaminopimelate desuccinylase-like protein
MGWRLESGCDGLAVARERSEAWGQLARQLFGELIALDTTHESGDTTPAAELLARHLREAGFTEEDVKVTGPRPKNKNLVARLRGNDQGQPILFFAHLDVVAAPHDQWNTDPFTLTELNGYFYGRGAFDVKNECADLVANLIRLKKEGYSPARDIVVALTAGEEAGADYNGVTWLLENRKDLITAEYAINLDSGDTHNRHGQHAIFGYNLDEKTFTVWRLTAHGHGGHSDQPSPNNAIVRVAAAVARIDQMDFPLHLTPAGKTYLRTMAKVESGELASAMRALAESSGNNATELARCISAGSPEYNAQLHTTCVTTIIKGGFALNALPVEADSFVNCRVLPEESYEDVYRILKRGVGDEDVTVEAWLNNKSVQLSELPRRPAPQSAAPHLEENLARIAGEMWPGVPVAPVLQVGASDSVPLRLVEIPSYGVQGMFFDIEDGSKIVFESTRSGAYEVWMCRSDGSDLVQLTRFNSVSGTPRWSPDGQQIAFDSGAGGNADIYIVESRGGPPRRLTSEPSHEIVPSWSRDGRWIYFASNRSGSGQVWKMPAAGGPAVQVTRHGGFAAFESPDGRFLYDAKGLTVPGLWRIPTNGGEETEVISSLEAGYWGDWAVVEGGIYYLDTTTTKPAIAFFDFTTHRTTRVFDLENPPARSAPGLAVSPDKKTILYTQLDALNSDIMLVENFR